MPTLTTREHGEIHVHYHQVTRMADRLWRFGSPARRTAYVEKARQRLAAGPARHSDAAIVLAAGAGLPTDASGRSRYRDRQFSVAALTPPQTRIDLGVVMRGRESRTPGCAACRGSPYLVLHHRQASIEQPATVSSGWCFRRPGRGGARCAPTRRSRLSRRPARLT
jgi:hypothetical protein